MSFISAGQPVPDIRLGIKLHASLLASPGWPVGVDSGPFF